jgi:hypothetical protein
MNWIRDRISSRPAMKTPGFGFGALSMDLFPNVDTDVPFTWVGSLYVRRLRDWFLVMSQFAKFTLRQADAVRVLSKNERFQGRV